MHGVLPAPAVTATTPPLTRDVSPRGPTCAGRAAAAAAAEAAAAARRSAAAAPQRPAAGAPGASRHAAARAPPAPRAIIPCRTCRSRTRPAYICFYTTSLANKRLPAAPETS